MSFDAFAEGLRRAAGSPRDAADFAVERKGASFRVRLFLGSAKSAVFSGRYVGRVATARDRVSYREAHEPKLEAPRPLSISLRDETDGDRAAKESGVAVEAQTGDAAFDARFFIDSPSSEATVRAVLREEALRRAVVRLFDRGFSEVALDAKGFLITATIHRFGRVGTDYDALLEDFATILREVPVIEHRGEHPSDPSRMAVSAALLASVLGVCPTVGAMGTGIPSRCYGDDGEGGTAVRCSEEGCCTPTMGGACGGMLVGVLAMFALVQGVRGRSNSHRTRMYLLLLAVVLGAELGIIVVNLLRG